MTTVYCCKNWNLGDLLLLLMNNNGSPFTFAARTQQFMCCLFRVNVRPTHVTVPPFLVNLFR